jgi:2,4-didehydro-3-deoxy-L-rhamnonate hydrolase
MARCTMRVFYFEARKRLAGLNKMKLCRFREPGAERPAIIDENGVLRHLSAHIEGITPAHLSVQELASPVKITLSDLPVIHGNPRLCPPVSRVSKFIVIGLNYRDHAEEARMEIPESPANRSTGDNDASQ